MCLKDRFLPFDDSVTTSLTVDQGLSSRGRLMNENWIGVASYYSSRRLESCKDHGPEVLTKFTTSSWLADSLQVDLEVVQSSFFYVSWCSLLNSTERTPNSISTLIYRRDSKLKPPVPSYPAVDSSNMRIFQFMVKIPHPDRNPFARIRYVGRY